MKLILFAFPSLFLSLFPLQNPELHHTQKNSVVQTSTNVPREIHIPRLHVHLPVEIAPIREGSWQLSSEKMAFFGEGTATLGENGTMVIFAHRREGLFATLPQLEIGDTIVVKGNDMMYHVFLVTTKEVKFPKDTAFLYNKDKNTLTLLTCFGPEDSQRLIVNATFQRQFNFVQTLSTNFL